MNHDYRTDESRGHTPGSLVYILKFIVFRGVLNIECFRKSVAEIMAGTGLECLSVMHQCLDGVCCNGARKFFLIGFAALDYRDCKNVFAEVRIYV